MNQKKKTKAGKKALPTWQRRLKWTALWVGLPLLIYFIFFSFYSWPWMGHFNTHFFTDQGDGFQNVWNIWWVNESVTQLNQLPWHTTFLHFPHGTSLIGQTLNPFNGFMAIPLLTFLSLVQAFNIMVIFSFVVGGLTAFWLCHYFTKRYIASLIGGFIFTFSSYHFAHAIGHMQLVSLQWIPLFILLWWKLLTTPRYRYAAGSSFVLLLIILCDYYYFLYSVAAAVMILVHLWHSKQLPSFKAKQAKRPLILFSLMSLLIVLPLPLQLMLVNHNDPLLGSHPTRIFSTDILTPFIDGGFWRFQWITFGYWQHIKAYIAESSIYVGLSVLTLSGIAIWKRRKIHKDINLWIVLGILFFIFSLGPRLIVRGHSFSTVPMPYALLEKIVPGLKLSGVPVRMMLMTILATAVVSSMVLAKLDLRKRRGRFIIAAFFVVLFLELWPNKLPNNLASAYPKYLNVLKELPSTGGVMDDGAIAESWQLYGQTIHEKPIALGYISRTPTSVAEKDKIFLDIVSKREFSKFCSIYKIRYYTTPASRPLQADAVFPAIYDDGATLIYDLKNSPNC